MDAVVARVGRGSPWLDSAWKHNRGRRLEAKWVYWAIFVLVVDFMRNLLLIVGREIEPGHGSESPRFYSTLQLLGSTRPFLLHVMVSIGAAATVVYFSGCLHGWMRAAWALVYGMSIVGFLFLLLFSIKDQQVPFVSGTMGLRDIVGLVVSATELAGIILLLRAVMPPVLERFQLAEARLGLLLAGTVEVSRLYLSLPAYDAFRKRLEQLRRVLVLGDISNAEAKRRIDALIHGTAHNAITNERIQKCLSAWDLYFEAANGFSPNASALVERMKDTSGQSIDGVADQFAVLEKANREIKALLAKAEDIHASIQAQRILEGDNSSAIVTSAASVFAQRSTEAEALEKKRGRIFNQAEREFDEFRARQRRDQGGLV